MQIFEMGDVVALLRREVDMAGGQVAWSKRTGINRTLLNQILRGRRQVTDRIIAALDLRIIFTPGSGNLPQRLPYQLSPRRPRNRARASI